MSTTKLLGSGMSIGEFFASTIQSSMSVTYGISFNVRGCGPHLSPFQGSAWTQHCVTQGSELLLLTLGYVIAPLQGCTHIEQFSPDTSNSPFAIHLINE